MIQQEDIKPECQKAYDAIKDAEDRLKLLRSLCTHVKTFEGNYSWRIGASYKAVVCSDCGTMIENLTLKEMMKIVIE